MGWILRAFGWLAGWLLILAIGFFVYGALSEYSPEKIEKIAVSGATERYDDDTICVVSWNIGYAGLGDDMDFFMDGGRSVQSSYGRTRENLQRIVGFLLDSCSDADFILLQEVDMKAKRSYQINQYDTLVRSLCPKYKAFYARNFKTSHVPIPLSNPIGAVDAGLVTLSRMVPRSAVRVSYPNGTSWPQSMFDLKRCFLSLEILLAGADSSVLVVNNTHNSAYDDGGQRTSEIVYLNAYLTGKELSITAGDWNSNPPAYTSSAAEQSDEHFRPMRLTTGDFPVGYHFVADTANHSARYGYEPFDRETTTTTVIDFAVTSPRVMPVDVRCVDLGFENSDHNPVIYKFVIKK